MRKETVTPFEGISSQHKDVAIREIDEMNENEAAKLIAALKVCLLADQEMRGGLNERNRKRAWKMVHELGALMLKGREQ